jgi:hypothetical protein
MPNGARLLFIPAHPVSELMGPWMHFEFENGVVEYPTEEGEFQARFQDGRVINYGAPDATQSNKLWHCVDAVRSGRPPVCGIQTAFPHLSCVLAAQQAPVNPFPKVLVNRLDQGDDQLVFVDGLAEALEGCYQSWQMPSEAGLSWAVRPDQVDPSRFTISV